MTDDRPVMASDFERDRREHKEDHAIERIVARETAQRLEREVEQTAMRLERSVEEASVRIEMAVRTALAAVSKTAEVHAEAHAREHAAHERIHTVEKEQVAKAAAAVDARLEGMNEFRAALSDQANRAVPREYYDARHEDLRQRVTEGDKAMEDKIDLAMNQIGQRITGLERRADQQAGKSEGLTTTAKVVVGAVGLIAAVVSIVSLILAFNN